MRPKTPFAAFLSIHSIAFVFASHTNAAPFVNGNFETGPSLGGSSFINVPNGSTAIFGWTVVGTGVDYIGPDTWNISDGVRNIDLDGSGNPNSNQSATISQTFDTQLGKQYLVSFDLSGNPAGLPILKQIQVSASSDGQVFAFDIGTVVAPILPLSITYQRKTFRFVATSNSTTLSFKSLNASTGTTGYGAVIDNVTVQIQEGSSGVPVAASIFQAVEIVWTSVAGKTYQVQSTLTLEAPNWADFGESVLGDGTEKSAFDKTRDITKRFYRVIEIQ